MSDTPWSDVDRYLSDTFLTPDPTLDQALADAEAAGMPAIAVSPPQGKLLFVLAHALRARRILELGTLAGYSGIWMARALPSDGRLVTLEVNPKHADVARKNFARAGVLDRVDIIVGPAREALNEMIQTGAAPFDLIFIDADKVSYPDYFRAVLELSRAGTLIIADNVIRKGLVADPGTVDENALAIRRFNDVVAAEGRVTATAIQTVGSKGYDGFTAITVLTS